MRIRRGEPQDIAAMLELKSELYFQEQERLSTRGGFLLGSTEEGYQLKLSEGLSWVLEDKKLQGFAIALPDEPFKASEVWQWHGPVGRK